MRKIQIWAVVFSSLCITIVLVSFLLNAESGYMKYFNPRENTRRIFYVKKGERRRSLFVDLNKTIVVLIAIGMHIVTCADSPRSLSYISHFGFAKKLLQDVFIQVITFEGGFAALAFLR